MIALPYATSYAASKAAALNFSDSLREELRLSGRRQLRVLAVCPSYISTGLFDGAQAPLLTWILEPDFVAQQTVRAVEGDRSFLMLPWTARLLQHGWLDADGPVPPRLRLARRIDEHEPVARAHDRQRPCRDTTAGCADTHVNRQQNLTIGQPRWRLTSQSATLS